LQKNRHTKTDRLDKMNITGLISVSLFSSAEKNVEYIDCITAKRWANNLNPDCGIAIGSRPSKLFPALEMITTRRLKNEDGHTVRNVIYNILSCSVNLYISATLIGTDCFRGGVNP